MWFCLLQVSTLVVPSEPWMGADKVWAEVKRKTLFIWAYFVGRLFKGTSNLKAIVPNICKQTMNIGLDFK